MANKKFDNPKDQQIHETLSLAYEALETKGYKPIAQLAGFISSADGSYITFYNNARQSLEALDNDEILEHLLRYYFEN